VDKITIGIVDVGSIKVVVLPGTAKRKSIKGEYRNALLGIGVFLMFMGAVGFGGLMADAVSPVAAVANESLGYFSANEIASVNTPQVIAYYLTDGYSASYAVQEAAMDLGFAAFSSLFEDAVVSSLDGAVITSSVTLMNLVEVAFLGALPWWAWFLAGYAVAFATL